MAFEDLSFTGSRTGAYTVRYTLHEIMSVEIPALNPPLAGETANLTAAEVVSRLSQIMATNDIAKVRAWISAAQESGTFPSDLTGQAYELWLETSQRLIVNDAVVLDAASIADGDSLLDLLADAASALFEAVVV